MEVAKEGCVFDENNRRTFEEYKDSLRERRVVIEKIMLRKNGIAV